MDLILMDVSFLSYFVFCFEISTIFDEFLCYFRCFSYLMDFYKQYDQYFSGSQADLQIYLFGGDFFENRENMKLIKEVVENNRYVVNGSFSG